MDLSLLYMVFPRLSESRRVLAKSIAVTTDRYIINLRKSLPKRRDRQAIRLVSLDDITWRIFCRSKENVRVSGISETGEYISLNWAGTGGGSIDFSVPHDKKFKLIEVSVENESRVLFNVLWIDETRIK